MAHSRKEYACIWNFWTIVPRGDGGENGLSSGTFGLVASRDDGAIFLTAPKTNKGSVRRGFLLTLFVPPQIAGHDLIPTPGLEERTDGKSVCRKRFPDTDSKKGLLLQLFKFVKLLRH